MMMLLTLQRYAGEGRRPFSMGNQIVILVGDFLYSNALRKAVSFKNQRIMEALSEATTSMTEGEILQLPEDR